jgi:hypothetical protein
MLATVLALGFVLAGCEDLNEKNADFLAGTAWRTNLPGKGIDTWYFYDSTWSREGAEGSESGTYTYTHTENTATLFWHDGSYYASAKIYGDSLYFRATSEIIYTKLY